MVTRVGSPVQANGSDVVVRSATDVSKYTVRMQRNSIETYACFSSKRQVAAHVCDEDQLPETVLVFAGHLNHWFLRVQKDLFQVSPGTSYRVTPHPAIADLEPGGRGEKGRKGNSEQGYPNSGPVGLFDETFKEVTEQTSPMQRPHPGYEWWVIPRRSCGEL